MLHVPHISYVVPATLLAMLAAGCGSTATKELMGPGDTMCSVSADAPQQTLASGGASVTVPMTASRDCLWSADSQSPWIQVAPSAGQGGTTLTIVAVANTGLDGRSGTVTVNSFRLVLFQAGASPAPPSTPSMPSGESPPTPTCVYVVTPRQMTVSNDGDNESVSVSTISGCRWTADTKESWIDITSGSSGNGAGTVRFSVKKHNGKGARTGSIVVAGITVTITQPGK